MLPAMRDLSNTPKSLKGRLERRIPRQRGDVFPVDGDQGGAAGVLTEPSGIREIIAACQNPAQSTPAALGPPVPSRYAGG